MHFIQVGYKTLTLHTFCFFFLINIQIESKETIEKKNKYINNKFQQQTLK